MLFDGFALERLAEIPTAAFLVVKDLNQCSDGLVGRKAGEVFDVPNRGHQRWGFVFDETVLGELCVGEEERVAGYYQAQDSAICGNAFKPPSSGLDVASRRLDLLFPPADVPGDQF